MARDSQDRPPEEQRLLLNALADGELDAATALDFERRLASEPALRTEYERIQAAKSALRKVPKPMLGDGFRQRIEALAGSPPPKSASVVVAAPSPPPAQGRRPAAGWRMAGGGRELAAAALVGVVLGGGGVHLLTAPDRPDQLEAAITDSHRRSLLAANPVDVVTSDQHTVKPWLDARLGVSPPAINLAGKGFQLVGGRVDVLGGRSVPSLVYRHNEHLISLFAVPVGADVPVQEPVSLDVGGYHVVRWTGKGFAFWAVSDLEPGELRNLVSLYRSQT